MPARSLGYQLVPDYRIDQLGLQGTHQGMILVDDSFYCPAMSEALINATKDFRDGKIDEATLWVLRMSSGYLEQDLPETAEDDETGPWPSRFSTSPSPGSSSWCG